MFLLKNRRLRRSMGFVLVVAGGILMWLAPEVEVGIALLAAGVLLEIAGIALERRDGR